MQFCAQHADHIDRALADRGLSALASDLNDEELIRHKLGDAKWNGPTFDNFDPMGGVVYSIATATMARFGWDAIELLLPAGPGFESCPICYLDAHCDYCGRHDVMIDSAADLQLDLWRQLARES